MTAVTEARCESEHFVAVARGSGRQRDILLFRIGHPDTPIVVESGNPSAATVRERILSNVPNTAGSERVECGQLLRQLADAASKTIAKVRNGSGAGEPPEEIGEEPWPEPVDAAALLDSIRKLLARFMVLPDHAPTVMALWVAHTYCIAAADYTPYLLITSPVRECGKSTLLELLHCLAYRAQLTGGITAGALYRRIDRARPTILLDELDTRLKGEGGENLRGVLNTGFHRSGKVIICVGEAHEDRDFNTFCPKALAGIGRPWDTVVSRSIPVKLERASRESLRQLAKIRGDRISAECEPYRRRLLRWSADWVEDLRDAEPEVPTQLGARQSDVWRPLLAIADAAGGDWPEQARRAAVEIYGSEGDEGDSALLVLDDVRAIFAARGSPTALFSETIVEELVALEHRPWPEYRHGQQLTKNGLAKLLGRFSIKPKLVREGTLAKDQQRRGYKFAELAPVFAKYLLPYHPEKVSHPSHSQASSGNTRPSVTDVTENPGGAGGVGSGDQYELAERAGLESGL